MATVKYSGIFKDSPSWTFRHNGFGVTVSVSPFRRHHFGVTISVSPFRCCRFGVEVWAWSFWQRHITFCFVESKHSPSWKAHILLHGNHAFSSVGTRHSPSWKAHTVLCENDRILWFLPWEDYECIPSLHFLTVAICRWAEKCILQLLG